MVCSVFFFFFFGGGGGGSKVKNHPSEEGGGMDIFWIHTMRIMFCNFQVTLHSRMALVVECSLMRVLLLPLFTSAFTSWLAGAQQRVTECHIDVIENVVMTSKMAELRDHVIMFTILLLFSIVKIITLSRWAVSLFLNAQFFRTCCWLCIDARGLIFALCSPVDRGTAVYFAARAVQFVCYFLPFLRTSVPF